MKEVTGYSLLISWSIIFLAVHTASHKNQNSYVSSDPIPLKTGRLMSSFIWSIEDLRGEGGGEGGELAMVY